MSKYTRVGVSPGDDIEASTPPVVQNALVKLYLHFKESFKSLSTCPRELYVNFFLKFCESYGYFSISQILVIYLHKEFGASDVRAGGIYGAWGASITLWGLMISWLNDNFGVRNSLLMGFTISLISSIILATATSLSTIYIVLFCMMPMGTAMGIPMLTVGIKRYTNTKNRGFAFGLYYSVMNVAAFVSGPVVDIFNIGFKSGVTFFGRHWSGNRLVILSTTCTYTASLVVTYFFLREIRVQQEVEDTENDVPNGSSHSVRSDGSVSSTEGATSSSRHSDHSRKERGMHGIEMVSVLHRQTSDEPLMMQDVQLHEHDRNGRFEDEYSDHSGSAAHSRSNDRQNASSAGSSATADTSAAAPAQAAAAGAVVEFVPEQRNLASVWKELVSSATFWRFSVLTLFLINLNTIFRHLDATLPTYLIRCFGPNYPKGIIYSINPFIIMWLTPVIAALTTTYPHYDMIKYGGYVSAVSPFFMAMATQTWAVVLFVVFLSLGEAIWSPRVYDYTMSIAPEGREASFSTLATAPLFAAKVPVGLLSGYLVSTYLPEDGSKPDGQTLWLILGLVTMTSPLLITAFEPCIREPARKPAAVSRASVSPEEPGAIDDVENPLADRNDSFRGEEGDEQPHGNDVDNDRHSAGRGAWSGTHGNGTARYSPVRAADGSDSP